MDGRRAAAIAAIIAVLLIGAWVLSIHHVVDITIEGEGTADPSEARVGIFESLEIRLVPAEGWEIGEVLLDGEPVAVDDGILRIGRVTSDRTVHVVFVESKGTVSLEVVTDEGGTSDPQGVTDHPIGDRVTVRIIPDDGFVIEDVAVDGEPVGSVNRLELTMDRDRSVDISFRPADDGSSGTPADPWVEIRVDVSPASSAQGYGSVDPFGRIRVAYGGTLICEIGLNPGYSVRSIVSDGMDLGKGPVFSLEGIRDDTVADVSVVRDDVERHTVAVSSSKGGSIEPSGLIEVFEGDSISFSIRPDRGYRLAALMIDGASVGSDMASYVLKGIDADHTVQACFQKESPGPSPSRHVTSLILSGQPETGFVGEPLDLSGLVVLAMWSDGSTTRLSDSDYTVEPRVPASAGVVTVEVSYEGVSATFQADVRERMFSVTVVQHEGGIASAEPSEAAPGTTILLRANPSSGYRLSGWSVDGATIGADSFIMPGRDVTVEPIWTRILVERISIDPASMVLGTGAGGGESKRVDATVLPIDAFCRTVAWTSSNDSVATVDADGTVTAIAVGTAIITATSTDGSGVSATCQVTVQKGLKVTVDGYRGQKAVDGSRVDFDERPGVPLSGFTMDASDLLPGMSQTVSATAVNLTSSDVGIVLRISATGDSLLMEHVVFVVSVGSRVVAVDTAEGLRGLSLELGSIGPGGSVTFAVTMSLGDADDSIQGMAMEVVLEAAALQAV